MITDTLDNWKTLPGLASHPVWQAAFEWIEANAATAEIGMYDLGVGNAMVRVMEYELKERGAARYESHRETIDLQYTISGAEGIEVQPVELLEADGDYLPEKDFQFYHPIGKGRHRVDNVTGNFCILYPQDGHMPQLYVNGFTAVRKLVVKIPVSSVVVV